MRLVANRWAFWGVLLFVASAALAQRSYVDLDSDWRFIKQDPGNGMMVALDDSSWRKVNVPHDWSIEGPFSADFAAGTGFAPGGIGWYRKHFSVDAAHQGKAIAVEFDGVYEESKVYINGFIVGGRPYGYSSFECDLTPYIKFGGDNVLAVRVDHSRYADSRWYTGSGIYRNVRLRIANKLSVAFNGIYVTTPQVSNDSATVQIENAIVNATGAPQTFSVQSEIIAPDGRSVGTQVAEASQASQRMMIDHPQLWSLESPVLYTLKTRIVVGGAVVDEVSTPFGVRSIRFDPDKGFFLNEQSLKLKGVCIHHDAGALGAAVPEKVLERRLLLLKELGVNAIRTSHNPPAPELLDLCDRLGLLVKDEAFDEFKPAKNKWITGWNVGAPGHWGYADLFDEWSIRDVQDMVRRDRNHPSIVMWSIGNEVDYANDPFSNPVLGNDYKPLNPPGSELTRLGKPLVEAIKKLDTTRPVTAALANVPMSNAVGFADILDLAGYNYQESLYASDHQKYPKRVIFGSENHHDYAAWLAVRDNDYISGQFLWTGIDYLGEANRWPSRGNSAGLLDTCGFKKPLAWFRQSLWSDKPMVYLCTAGAAPAGRRGGRGGAAQLQETWNRITGSEASITCYSNCEQVQLFLNDKLIGTKQRSEAVQGVFNWSVPFEAGTLKAVGMNKGAPASEFTLKTAGDAAKVVLHVDQAQLVADGKDVGHIEFDIVDAQGVRLPDARNAVKFQIDGPAQLLGIDNGEMSGTTDYRSLEQTALRGRGLAILQSTGAAGSITVTVASPGLESATVQLVSRAKP